MNGQFMAYGDMKTGPWYDNVAAIQFLHRTMAVFVACGFLFWWYYCRAYVRDRHLGKSCAAVAAIIGIQFALGVETLLRGAPLNLALAHQLNALALFTAALALMHRLKRYGYD